VNRRPGRLRLVHSAGRMRPTGGPDCTRTYGLSRDELRREIRRLSALGWQLWELARRFDCTCKDYTS
jgi:hypothetical protein